MHGRPALLLLVSVAALALVASPADAQRTQEVDLSYEVGGLDPGNGTVTVDLVIENTDDVVEWMVFRTASHDQTVSNVSATGGRLEEVSAGFKLHFDPGPTVLRYTVGVERETFKGSEGFNAHLGPDWGVLKGESLGIGFQTRHDSRYDLVWDASLRFQLPDGWAVAGPWNRTDPGVYRLAPDEPLPRGFYAVGEDLDVTEHVGDWKTYRYVQLGADLSYEGDVLPYLEAATPYYSTVYGNHTGPNLLAISAPDPMHEGGLGGWNSLYVHDETDLKTLAHEYAHVWQRYRPVQTAENPDPDGTALEGGSSLWIVEGDADYRGPLSLVATEYWSPAEADEHFEEVQERAEREDRLTRPLDQATYGSPDERVAYQKGALVLHSFQRRLQAATDGQNDSATLVRELNARHSPVAPGYEDLSPSQQRVNNSEILSLVLDLASSASPSERDALSDAFGGYVHGDKAPSFDSIERTGHLSFSKLNLEPPQALEGDPSNVSVRVTNTGPTEQERSVELRVDGDVVDSEDIQLAAGGSTILDLRLPDLAPGSYTVRVAYLTADYRVLEPPDLELADLELVPSEITQGETATVLATVRNAGGAPGEAAIEVTLNGEPRGSAGKRVEGGLEETLTTTIEGAAAGEHAVAVTLLQDGTAVGSGDRVLTVLADADGDGVPDREDDYPDNPAIAEKSTLNDLRNVPGPGTAAVLAGVAAALLARRRR